MTQNIKNDRKTVVVALSGGVDSSVTAVLLARQGYNVVGLHMKNMNSDSAKADEQSVKDLCDKLHISYKVIEVEDEMNKVKDYFFNEYKNGRTPNPCVFCNKMVKFKPFIDFAKQIGADYFATGHYAKIEHTPDGKHNLIVSKDSNKDQTYFLNQLSSDQLSMALFPLGDLSKDEVRKIAEENNLSSAHKKDSQDVCFVGSEKFQKFMSENLKSNQGQIKDATTLKVLGTHNGLEKFTLGQRKGLKIGGGNGKTGEAWFVCDKDLKTNTLYVVQGNEDKLYSSSLETGVFNWIKEKQEKTFDCFAKFRYHQTYQKVKVIKNDDGTLTVIFAEKQRAITLGQFAVLYEQMGNDYYCLGGASIEKINK